MRKTIRPALGLILAGAAASGATAQDGAGAPRPAALQALVACREVAADGARLACFDRAAAALDAAEQSGEVVVVDRERVRATRRDLFGFDLPSIAAFTGRGVEEPADESIQSTLVSASSINGQWVVTLENGSTWRQIDTGRPSIRTRPGTEVRIRRAAMGSYLMSVDGSRGIRVRRER